MRVHHATPTIRHVLKCQSRVVGLTSVLTVNLTGFDVCVWRVVGIQCTPCNNSSCSHWWQCLPHVVVFLFISHHLLLNCAFGWKKNTSLCDDVIKNIGLFPVVVKTCACVTICTRPSVFVCLCMTRDRKRQARNPDADKWKEFSFVVCIIYLFHSEPSHSLVTLSVRSQGPVLWYHLGWRGSSPL